MYRFESLPRLPIRTNHGHADLPSKERKALVARLYPGVIIGGRDSILSHLIKYYKVGICAYVAAKHATGRLVRLFKPYSVRTVHSKVSESWESLARITKCVLNI